MSKPADLVQGTLDMLLLKILALGPMNGFAVSQRLKQVSGDVFTGQRRIAIPGSAQAGARGLDHVIVLGYSFWQTRFGGDPGIVGKTVLYNGRPVTVIGITPKEFHGVSALVDIQGYLPLGMQQVDSSYEQDMPTNRGLRNLALYARLSPEVSLQKAQSALDVIGDRLAKENPKTEEGMTISVFPERFSRPGPDPDRPVLKVSLLFLVLAALVEMAIRTALGGTRLLWAYWLLALVFALGTDSIDIVS